MIDLIVEKEIITCTECNLTKPATEEFFYKQKYKTQSRGEFYKLVNPCKECRAKRSRERKRKNKDVLNAINYQYFLENKERIYYLRNKWMEEHKEEMKQYQREYRKNNKDKMKEYNSKYSNNKKHDISKKEWNSCKEYFNNECAYCGIKEEDAKRQQGQNLHKEHFVNKGENDLTNCVPSCRSCNSSKWEYDFEEWYTEDNPIYDEVRKEKIYSWINSDHKIYIKKKQ